MMHESSVPIDLPNDRESDSRRITEGIGTVAGKQTPGFGLPSLSFLPLRRTTDIDRTVAAGYSKKTAALSSERVVPLASPDSSSHDVDISVSCGTNSPSEGSEDSGAATRRAPATVTAAMAVVRRSLTVNSDGTPRGVSPVMISWDTTTGLRGDVDSAVNREGDAGDPQSPMSSSSYVSSISPFKPQGAELTQASTQPPSQDLRGISQGLASLWKGPLGPLSKREVKHRDHPLAVTSHHSAAACTTLSPPFNRRNGPSVMTGYTKVHRPAVSEPSTQSAGSDVASCDDVGILSAARSIVTSAATPHLAPVGSSEKNKMPCGPTTLQPWSSDKGVPLKPSVRRHNRWWLNAVGPFGSHSIRHFIREYPIVFWATIATVFSILSIVTSIVFLVVIPNIIQRCLNDTALQLQSAIISNPKSSSFDLKVRSTITRDRSTAVKLEEFTAQVFWVTDQETSLQWSGRDFGASNGIQADALEDGGKLLRRVTANEDAFDPIKDGVSGVLIGEMVLPKTDVAGLEQEQVYETVFRVKEPLEFADFLQTFTTTGHALWILKGRPSVTLARGLTYHDMVFEKFLHLDGPQLGRSVSRAGEKVPTAERLKITAFDLTGSTMEQAVLRLLVQMDQSGSKSTINPVGVIGLESRFDGTPVLDLKSTSPVSLRPGINELEFVGYIPSLDDPLVDAGRRTAVGHLLADLLRGDAPELVTVGRSCSIPLFLPAVEALSTTLRLNPFKETVGPGLSSSVSDRKPSLPIIKDMQIVQMQLKPLPDVHSDVGRLVVIDDEGFRTGDPPRATKRVLIEGIASVVLYNPLGPGSPLSVPEISMAGDMTAKQPNIAADLSTASDADESYIGQFHGVLRQRPVLSLPETPDGPIDQIGTMAVSPQSLQFDMALTLLLSDDGRAFKQFMGNFINASEVGLNMRNVKADVKTQSALGSLDLTQVPLERELKLTGLDRLREVRLESFAIESLPIFTMLTKPERADGGVISAKVRVPSRSAARVELGDLNIDLLFKGQHMLYMTAKDCVLAPGDDNIFEFRGMLRLNEVHVPSLVSMVSGYMSSKKENSVTVRFISSVPGPVTNSEGPEVKERESVSDEQGEEDFIKGAIVGMELTMPLVKGPPRNSKPKSPVPLAEGPEGEETMDGMGIMSNTGIYTTSAPFGTVRTRGGGPLGLGLLPGLLGRNGRRLQDQRGDKTDVFRSAPLLYEVLLPDLLGFDN